MYHRQRVKDYGAPGATCFFRDECTPSRAAVQDTEQTLCPLWLILMVIRPRTRIRQEGSPQKQGLGMRS